MNTTEVNNFIDQMDPRETQQLAIESERLKILIKAAFDLKKAKEV